MKEDELLMRLLKKKGLPLVSQYLGNCADCGMVGWRRQVEAKGKEEEALLPLSLPAQLTPFSIPAVVLGGTRPQWANFLRRKKEGRTQSVPPCPPVSGVFLQVRV